MSVNATGLGELLGMPELSVQTAIRPGIPTSAPDFLSIMTLKAATPAKGAVPGLPVGLPSAGDGNPTTEDVQAVAVSGAAFDQADESADMAFDLQLPTVPAQQSPAPAPKKPGAHFATIAARHRLAAEAQSETPATAKPETDTVVPELGTDTESHTPETLSISPEALAAPQPMPLPVPPAASAVVVAPTASLDQAESESVAVAGQVRPTPNGGIADHDKSAAPAMQHPAVPSQAVRSELRAVVDATEKADPAPRAFVDRADSETPNTPAPREALPASQTAQAVLAAVHDPLSARPQVTEAAQGQAVPNEALLDDLLIGNAVEDQWVDQLAADVQTLVNGDRREAQLHLKPRELGDLFIRVETNGNQAKVHFTVETAAAQGFIADAAPRLQSMMENRGVRLEEASVDVGSGRQDRGEQSRETAFEQPFSTRPRGAASQAETVRAIVRQTAIERFA